MITRQTSFWEQVIVFVCRVDHICPHESNAEKSAFSFTPFELSPPPIRLTHPTRGTYAVRVNVCALESNAENP